MIELTADGRQFYVEVKHRLKRELYQHGPVNGVTTVAIVGVVEGVQFAALGTAICFAPDQFDRRYGRLRAFEEALKCGLLKPHREALLDAWVEREKASFEAPKPKQRVPLPEDEKQRRITAGEAVRAKRKATRQ